MMLLKHKTLALWTTLSTLIAGFILKANVALAASATDPFVKTQTDAAKLTTKIQTWSVIIIVLVVVATAVAYALGGKQVKKWVRSYWWGILIAIVIIFGASQFIAWYMNYLNLK
ncbi:TrbC/VirB2 family protein [Lactococcus petauri]|uniref:TrbC/VirB2 family protein n=1 Tax=Lactococcus petauri TaxID=1940789 RepID=UPI001F55C9B8|nr:TrbC/VirB2 family protein [Lactococcus petauri]